METRLRIVAHPKFQNITRIPQRYRNHHVRATVSNESEVIADETVDGRSANSEPQVPYHTSYVARPRTRQPRQGFKETCGVPAQKDAGSRVGALCSVLGSAPFFAVEKSAGFKSQPRTQRLLSREELCHARRRKQH